MSDASRRLIDVLRTRGYRITNARVAVVEILTNAAEPLSISMIVERATADEASVYRTVELLQREGLINEVQVRGGALRFELSHHHHHHAVCTECGMVVHLPCGEEPKAPRRVLGFARIISHDLTFYGLCSKCAIVCG